MEPWQTREWFADYLEAGNRHDLEALRSLIDPAVRRAHLPGGADAWLADLADLFAAFPDWRWKRIQLVVEEDRLAAHLRASGTHLGTFHGIPATRRHVNVAEFGFYRLAGGRVADYTGSATDALLARISG
jgi:predicted ester cyclase